MEKINRNASEEFSKLITKFLYCNCIDNSNRNNIDELNSLLNELNSLDYRTWQIIDKSALHLLESLKNIPAIDDTLVIKSCCLIVSLMNSQNIQLPKIILKETINWLLKCLNYNFNIIICNVLKALQCLIKGNVEYLKEFYDCLMSPDGLFIRLLNVHNHQITDKLEYDTNKPEEIQLSVMLCIETFLYSLNDCKDIKLPLEYLNKVGNAIVNLIYTKLMDNLEEHSYCKFVTSVLNSCKYICLMNEQWANEYLGEILGAAKAYVFHGLTEFPQIKPKKIVISQQALIEPQNINLNKGGKISKIRKPQVFGKRTKNKGGKTSETKRNDEVEQQDNLNVDRADSHFLSTLLKTSDSDFSSAESNRTQKDCQKQAKVRISAISLIGILAKTIEKKIFVGYWHSIFPQEYQSQANVNTMSILNCVIRDPNPKCRIAALQTISMVLHGTKPFLIQAEYSEKPSTSFIPFSITLGNMISTIYAILTESLAGESSLQVLFSILKCLSALIQVTPLHKLQNGIVTTFVVQIRKLVYHTDKSVQIAALMVMGFLLSTQEITSEISACIGIQNITNLNNKKTPNQIHNFGDNEVIDSECDEDDPYDETDLLKFENNNNQIEEIKISWLLQSILQNLGVSVYQTQNHRKIQSTIELRIESFQVLFAIGPHFILLKQHLPLISEALKNGFNDDELILYAVRCLDVIGYSMNTYLLTNTINTDYLNICLQFWLTMLPCIIKQIQHPNQPVALKIVCCDTLSNIGIHVFERLPRDKQIVLISLLSGCAFDGEMTICASAVRALAVYVKFPSLCEDLCYVENTIESIIRLLKVDNLVVRIKASWSLANITDTFIDNISSVKKDIITNDLLKRLLEISIEMSNDNDKVRCNAVRIIGNLLRLITTAQLQHNNWQELCYKSIERLIHNSLTVNSMKVKWNSCYAIGNFMRNTVMFKEMNNLNWKELTFPVLSNIIVNCPIFKVRINGATALAIPTERQYYDKYFIEIWAALLCAVVQADHVDNVNEYKHRDNLLEQLCITIAHLINLCNPNDLVLMKNELIQHIDLIKLIWSRIINRIVSEKVTSLLSACMKLKDLESQSLAAEQKSSIKILKSCFIEINEYT